MYSYLFSTYINKFCVVECPFFEFPKTLLYRINCNENFGTVQHVGMWSACDWSNFNVVRKLALSRRRESATVQNHYNMRVLRNPFRSADDIFFLCDFYRH